MLTFLDTAETASLLRAIAPACKEPDAWAEPLSTAMFRFGISNDLDLVAAFIAQLMVESAELNSVIENLYYKADRLMVVWPSRFPTIAIAQRYAHNPRALANFVYANRMGNGPPESDEGWRYIARGPIGTTGKANYARLEWITSLPLLEHPELLEQKAHGAFAAAWFWWENRLSFFAADLPKDDQADDFITLTRRVNGGTHGLARRQAYWRAARAHLSLPAM